MADIKHLSSEPLPSMETCQSSFEAKAVLGKLRMPTEGNIQTSSSGILWKKIEDSDKLLVRFLTEPKYEGYRSPRHWAWHFNLRLLSRFVDAVRVQQAIESVEAMQEAGIPPFYPDPLGVIESKTVTPLDSVGDIIHVGVKGLFGKYKGAQTKDRLAPDCETVKKFIGAWELGPRKKCLDPHLIAYIEHLAVVAGSEAMKDSPFEHWHPEQRSRVSDDLKHLGKAFTDAPAAGDQDYKTLYTDRITDATFKSFLTTSVSTNPLWFQAWDAKDRLKLVAHLKSILEGADSKKALDLAKSSNERLKNLCASCQIIDPLFHSYESITKRWQK